MAKEIKTQITIQASANTVWNILMDFNSYPEWNPFIKKLEGNPSAGERLNVFIQPANSKGMTFTPKVLVAEPNKHFEWVGNLLFKGIFDGRHAFIIREESNKECTLFHEEYFSGILSFIYNTDNAKAGFEAMNEMVKLRAEKEAV